MKFIKLFEDFTSNINDNFWKWFGNSKIVDTDGEPLVVYHGSKTMFDSFDDKKKGSGTDYGLRGRGFYFSTNINSSKAYGGNI